jgi:Tfp pilus assembly protein PilZ
VQPRVQRVGFATADIFQREHTENLAKGGIFVASTESFALRDSVTVELLLEFCDKKVALDGEVVHIVPPELAPTGAEPGIAVQFLGSTSEVAKRLEPLVQVCGIVPQPPQRDSGRRASPRVAARVPVRVEGAGAGAEGTTRNLSQTGVLVAVDGDGISLGQRVRVTLEHPITGEAMEVEGRIAREVETGGAVSALGIEFDPPEGFRDEVSRFVEQVQSIEHTRRLGGISGSIEELGCQNLLQMLGNASPSGTLVLRNGEDEGVIAFERQLLRYVRLGNATGMKALGRLLSWQEGSFEFLAQLEPEPGEEMEAPLPLEAAIFEAVRGIDESARIDRALLPATAKVVVADDAGEPLGAQEPLSKVEAAVIDLARADLTVQRIIDVIPDADSEILYALASLADRGMIRFEI